MITSQNNEGSGVGDIPSPPTPPESYKAKSKWFGLIVEKPPKRL